MTCPVLHYFPGSLPPQITLLTALEYLDLSYNALNIDEGAHGVTEWLGRIQTVALYPNQGPRSAFDRGDSH